jgi:hypothetical protein
MRSMKFNILPAPEILKNDVERFRIVEYSGEEGLAIKVSPKSLSQEVDDFYHDQAGYSYV